MATATFKWYGATASHLADADIDWVADTIHCSLHTSSYTPNQDTHDYGDDLTNECPQSGHYTTGGAAVRSRPTNSSVTRSSRATCRPARAR